MTSANPRISFVSKWNFPVSTQWLLILQTVLKDISNCWVGRLYLKASLYGNEIFISLLHIIKESTVEPNKYIAPLSYKNSVVTDTADWYSCWVVVC